jgi:hypothetical protein
VQIRLTITEPQIDVLVARGYDLDRTGAGMSGLSFRRIAGGHGRRLARQCE